MEMIINFIKLEHIVLTIAKKAFSKVSYLKVKKSYLKMIIIAYLKVLHKFLKSFKEIISIEPNLAPISLLGMKNFYFMKESTKKTNFLKLHLMI